ncbi:Protein CBG21995 [Caenorhabditis briggsae]|uniref:Protein CBG21995 n=1 Tax=Caenorhabditis briggsae TaxID=6238 RepID=A8Y1A8_CAEBR|nr:Protein CBG21995 [Caenorhabditis briggsae]CAP38677.1 Protein CBG21995 [Caenorhabditis briggsae]
MLMNGPSKKKHRNLASSSRLGNHLFELSSLLAISRKLNRTPTVFAVEPYHEKMLQDTDLVIPGLLDHFLIINSTLLTPLLDGGWDTCRKAIKCIILILDIRMIHQEHSVQTITTQRTGYL